MNTRGKLQVYTFAVTLIETITVKARNEEKARAVLTPSPAPLFHGPYRSVDYEEKERILGQELRQEQVELLSVEDDPLSKDDENDKAGELIQDGFRQLEQRLRRIEARLDALECSK